MTSKMKTTLMPYVNWGVSIFIALGFILGVCWLLKPKMSGPFPIRSTDISANLKTNGH